LAILQPRANTAGEGGLRRAAGFCAFREAYLDDSAFAELQRFLITDPEAGAVIQGTGGLRKIRFADKRRGKGKRGGLRIVYYWWSAGRGPERKGEASFEGHAEG
jgi:hypothetical protein